MPVEGIILIPTLENMNESMQDFTLKIHRVSLFSAYAYTYPGALLPVFN